jgi:predicted TPR repeat methyltransferase
MSARPRLTAPYFERLYADDPDPWRFETSPYERAKYDATIAALEGRRYAKGLEIGCSIGVLTERLTDHVDDLLAVDVSAAALQRARARVPTVRFERRELPEDFPDGEPFDLIVASEVLYYLDPPALDTMLDRLANSTVLAVHWRHPTQTYPLTGDEVHARLSERLGPPAYSAHTDDYALDRWDS